MRILQYTITAEHAGKKIEWFLRGDMGISRRVIVSLRHQPGNILLNGQHARTIDLLSQGDVLEIRLVQAPSRGWKSDLQVAVLFEDDDVIIYDKPAGMPCHQSGGHFQDTLANVYVAHCEATGMGGPFRPVNRLDKDTTGAVVAAKNQIAAGILWKRVRKCYVALVEGDLERDSDIIDLPIAQAEPYGMLRVVDPDGQEAVTEYRVLQRFGSHTLVECTLHTGRTHQIRVHMSHLGHPLAGDDLYGGSRQLMGRQALHCAWVGFEHPITHQAVEIEAPMHDDMKNALKNMEKSE